MKCEERNKPPTDFSKRFVKTLRKIFHFASRFGISITMVNEVILSCNYKLQDSSISEISPSPRLGCRLYRLSSVSYVLFNKSTFYDLQPEISGTARRFVGYFKRRHKIGNYCIEFITRSRSFIVKFSGCVGKWRHHTSF